MTPVFLTTSDNAYICHNQKKKIWPPSPNHQVTISWRNWIEPCWYSKQPYLMDGNGEATPVSRLSCPRPLRQGLHVAGASLLLEESCRWQGGSGGSLVDFLHHLVYLLAYQPLVSLNKALSSPWKIHGKALRAWWQLKYFWNFHPDPWGNDPIWPAYFLNGLVQPPTCITIYINLSFSVNLVWYDDVMLIFLSIHIE